MIFILDSYNEFPDANLADDNGLLAVGGRISHETILKAYMAGIFPWYSKGDPILWWSPDPRFVLFPQRLHISSSMKKVIRKNSFNVTFNQCFEDVITLCGKTRSKEGTWINKEIIRGYTDLFHMGKGISAEAWLDDELVGGLYGVIIGKVFFGESMFSKVPNASKTAFIKLVEYLEKLDIRLIDCQVYTDHLNSLGAELIPRSKYLELLKEHTNG